MRLLLASVTLALGCGPPPEICDNGLDDNSNELHDCDDPACAEDPACEMAPEMDCDDLDDDDSDGYVDCDDEDCWDDPACTDVTDGEDLPPPDGDPAVDLEHVGVSLEGGVGTIFATTYGDWPPVSSTYSYYINCEFNATSGTTVAGVTIQLHDGAPSTIPVGINILNVTVRESAAGVWIRMNGVQPGATHYSVEAGIQKTSTGTRVVDNLAATPQPLP